MSNSTRGGKGSKLKAVIAESDADTDACDGVNLSPDAWIKMKSIIDGSVALKIKEYTDQSAQSFNGVNLKLEAIGKRIEAIQGKYQTDINDIRARLDDPNITTDEATGLKIKGLEKQIDLLLKLRTEDRECDRYLTYHHLVSAVRREQRQRSWALRVYGYQPTWREHTPDVTEVFQDIIEPVLQARIDSGDSVKFNTNFYSCIEYAHQLAPGKKGAVPPMIFRFHSRRILFLFMLNKREHVANLQKKSADRNLWANSAQACKFDPKVKLRISHDLADMNRQVMSFLHTAKIAHKCKTTSAGVSFMPVGYNGKWVKINNPFSPTLSGLLEPLPDINDLLTTKSIVLEAYQANVPNIKLFEGLNVNLKELIQVADQHAKKQPAILDGGVDPGISVCQGLQEVGGVPSFGGAAAGADVFPALPSPSAPAEIASDSPVAATAASVARAATVAAGTRAAAAAAATNTANPSTAPPK